LTSSSIIIYYFSII